MPELPEVEIVVRNLQKILSPPFFIKDWVFFRKNLRFVIPKNKLRQLMYQKILSVSRRAKYLLFETDTKFIILHLGMTGSWRLEKSNWSKRTHDHVAFEFGSNQFLVYEDARRFGFIEVCAKNKIEKRFQHVGVEPLAESFNQAFISRSFKKLNSPIKNALMNQKFVVGIGNIYASEILFRAQVSPLKNCSRITLKQYAKIWECTKTILQNAIEQGGSTVDNYKNSFGESGNFQNLLRVYGREGEFCFVCGTEIKSKFLAGRNTFWCPACQK